MLVRRDGATVAAPETAATGAADSLPTELSSSSISRENENQQAELITIPEMREIQQSGAPNLVLDVRSDRSFADSDLRALGALRIPPDRAVERLTELDVPRQTWLFAFCA